jgi:hypothetical protein
MEKEIKKAAAIFEYSFQVDCPFCGNEIDLTHSDHEGMYVNNYFKHLVNYTEFLEYVYCDKCDKEFVINSVDIY